MLTCFIRNIIRPDNIEIDVKLFEDLLKHYEDLLKPESFSVKEEDLWNNLKGQNRCFAIDLLFHK